MFCTAAGVSIGCVEIHIGIFRLHFSMCYFSLFRCSAVILVNLVYFLRLAPSEVLPVVSWLVLFLVCLALLVFASVYFVSILSLWCNMSVRFLSAVMVPLLSLIYFSFVVVVFNCFNEVYV